MSASSFIFSIDTTLCFIKNSSVFDSQKQNLYGHYDNRRLVTIIPLFGWLFLGSEYSLCTTCSLFTAVISTLTLSSLSSHARNLQSPFRYTKTRHFLHCFKYNSSLSTPCLVNLHRINKIFTSPHVQFHVLKGV